MCYLVFLEAVILKMEEECWKLYEQAVQVKNTGRTSFDLAQEGMSNSQLMWYFLSLSILVAPAFRLACFVQIFIGTTHATCVFVVLEV